MGHCRSGGSAGNTRGGWGDGRCWGYWGCWRCWGDRCDGTNGSHGGCWRCRRCRGGGGARDTGGSWGHWGRGGRGGDGTSGTNRPRGGERTSGPHRGDWGNRRIRNGSGDMLMADNLSGLASYPTARSNLGLGGAALVNIGTGAGTAAAGDDARLSNARTPTAHAATHATGGADALTLGVSGDRRGGDSEQGCGKRLRLSGWINQGAHRAGTDRLNQQHGGHRKRFAPIGCANAYRAREQPSDRRRR